MRNMLLLSGVSHCIILIQNFLGYSHDGWKPRAWIAGSDRSHVMACGPPFSPLAFSGSHLWIKQRSFSPRSHLFWPVIMASSFFKKKKLSVRTENAQRFLSLKCGVMLINRN